MKIKFTVIFIVISTILFLIETTFDFDLIEYIFTMHSSILDNFLPVAIFSCIGIVIDYIIEIKRRKEREKILAYRATIKGTSHVLRSLMNNMLLLFESEAVRKEFGTDLIGILENSIHEGEEILTHLSELTDINSQTIKEVAEANLR